MIRKEKAKAAKGIRMDGVSCDGFLMVGKYDTIRYHLGFMRAVGDIFTATPVRHVQGPVEREEGGSDGILIHIGMAWDTKKAKRGADVMVFVNHRSEIGE